MSAEAATRVVGVDDLTAYDVPVSAEVADNPAVPGINGMIPALADSTELLAANWAADITVTAPVDVSADVPAVRLVEAREN